MGVGVSACVYICVRAWFVRACLLEEGMEIVFLCCCFILLFKKEKSLFFLLRNAKLGVCITLRLKIKAFKKVTAPTDFRARNMSISSPVS